MLTPAPADEGYLYVYGADASSGCDIRSGPMWALRCWAPLASSHLRLHAWRCRARLMRRQTARSIWRRPRGPCTRYVLISPMPNSSTTCVFMPPYVSMTARAALRPLAMDLDTVCLSGSSERHKKLLGRHFAQDWSKQHGHCSNENSSEPHDGVVHIATDYWPFIIFNG
jgi:hypothetical protein